MNTKIYTLTFFLAAYISSATAQFVEVFGKDRIIPNRIDVGSYSNSSFLDIDNDGDLDLIVGEEHSIITYLNDGERFVKDFDGYDTLVNRDAQYDYHPAFGDVDGDGDKDILVGLFNGDYLYFKNANGSYIEQHGDNNPFSIFNEGGNTAPEFIDYDNDGDMDVVAGAYYHDPIYYENDDGVFSKTSNPFYGKDEEIGFNGTLAFIDLDNDDDMDLVTGNIDGTFEYFRNSGGIYYKKTGTDNPFDTISVPYRSDPNFADIDNDGDLDFIAGCADGRLYYYEYEDGKYTQRKDSDNPFGGVRATTYEQRVTFGDVDNDQDLDIIIGDSKGKLASFENRSGSYYELIGDDTPLSTVDVQQTASPHLGDLDADGDLDLLVGDASGGVSYFKNKGEWNFEEQTGYFNPFNNVDLYGSASPFMIDFNKDGDMDVLISDGYNIDYYENTANVFILQTTGGPESADVEPFYLDFDLDGDLDIVSGQISGDMSYHENIDGEYLERIGEKNPFDAFNGVRDYASASFADLDGDGDMDMIFIDTGGELYEFHNQRISNPVKGIEENILELNLAPNPSKGIVTFRNPEGNHWHLINASGRIIHEGDSNEFDSSDFDPGVYLLRIGERSVPLLFEE